MKPSAASLVMLLGCLAVVPLLFLAAWHGWAGGGPPTTPERRQEHEFWLWVCITGALLSPAVAALLARRLRRRNPQHGNPV